LSLLEGETRYKVVGYREFEKDGDHPTHARSDGPIKVTQFMFDAEETEYVWKVAGYRDVYTVVSQGQGLGSGTGGGGGSAPELPTVGQLWPSGYPYPLYMDQGTGGGGDTGGGGGPATESDYRQTYANTVIDLDSRPPALLYYDFDYESGTTVPNQGTIAGADLTVGSGTSWDVTDGVRSLRVGGSTDENIAGATSGPISDANTFISGFTFMVRYKYESAYNNYGIMFTTGSWDSFLMHNASNGTIYTGHDPSANLVASAAGTTAAVPGEWNTLVFRSNSNTDIWLGLWRDSDLTNPLKSFDFNTPEKIWTRLNGNSPELTTTRVHIDDTSGSSQLLVHSMGAWNFEMTDAEVQTLLTRPTI
jgi:hypothetical protein